MRIKPDPFVIGTNFRNNGPLGSAEDGSVFIVDPHMSGQKAAEGQHYGYISKALNYDVNENEVIEDNRGSSLYFQEGVQIAAVEGSDLGELSSSVDYINGFRDSVVTFSDKSSMKIYIATRSLQNGGTYLDISDSHLELVQKYIADNGVRITSVKLGYWDNTEWDRFSIEAFDAELQQPPCFVRGTLIRTQDGTTPVEKLRRGQMVWTLDHGLQKILWIGTRKLNADELAQRPEWRPISLPVSAVDGSDSEHRLNVSPQHRILVDSAIAETMFGQKQVLVPAKALLSLPGAETDERADSVEYWHILLEHHAILEADGVLTESLYLGKQIRNSFEGMTSEELELILPEGAADGVTMLPARPFVTVRRATSLARRHVKNNRPLNRWPAPDTAAMQNGKTSMDGMRPC